jgi:hypothetical protein
MSLHTQALESSPISPTASSGLAPHLYASLCSVAPPRGSAEVLAGVWIGWASPYQGLQMVMEAPSAPLGAAAKAGCVWGGGGCLQGHWQELGVVILGYLLSD